MQTVKYIQSQEGDAWLGYLEEHPDYWTQGDSLDELVEHLKDLYLDLSGGQIPGAWKAGELIVSASESTSSRRSRTKVRHDMSTTLFLVFRNPGPSWVPGLPSRQQPLWDEHAVFMDRLFDQGRIVLGGPYADYSRVLLIVNAGGMAEASELFRDDPWTQHSMLVESEIVEWTVFLDSRRNPR